MTFLAPAAGIIGAALAVPALLLLYFLKLRRRPLRVSSVLLWEQAARDLQVNVPLRMIRWSWVLMLQLLALACLLIALARPALPGAGASGARVVIMVDCSASMNAMDVRGTGGPGAAGGARSRFDAAIDRAIELIDSMGRGGASRSRAMIVALDASPRSLTRFTTNLGELREAVRALVPTDQPEDLAAAMRLVEAMTADGAGEGESPAPVVYIVSDGGLESLSPQDRRGVVARHVYAGPARSPAADPRMDNLGIVALSAQRDPDDAQLVRVFARVLNAGAAGVPLAARCTLDGRLAEGGLASATVPGATLRADGEMEAGEAGLVFTIRQADPGVEQVVVVATNREDLLAADDAAALILPPVWRPRVLLVAPSALGEAAASASATAQPDVFLQQALEATEPAVLRVMSEAEFAAQVQSAAQTEGRFAPWRGFDLVVFDRIAPADLPDVPTLSFGVALPIQGLGLERPGEAGSVARVVAWQRNHAALRYVALDTLIVAPPAALRISAESGADAAGEPVRFAELVDGTFGPLIVEVEHGRAPAPVTRRIVAAFALERSNWGPDVSFPVFVANAVERLCEGAGRQRLPWSISTVDRLPVRAPGTARTVVARAGGPAGGDRSFELAGPSPGTDESAGLIGPLERAGVYRLTTASPGPVEPAAVAVNLLSDRESRLTARPRVNMGPGTAAEERENAGGEREVWHWFVLVALGLLSIEWFVYAWRMRA